MQYGAISARCQSDHTVRLRSLKVKPGDLGVQANRRRVAAHHRKLATVLVTHKYHRCSTASLSRGSAFKVNYIYVTGTASSY